MPKFLKQEILMPACKTSQVQMSNDSVEGGKCKARHKYKQYVN